MHELPMFPLGSVLLPSMLLPLHVFELRYRALVDYCVEGPGEFGVVLIDRGSEVGGGEHRRDIGTVAHIIDHERFEDGRSALMTVGTRRIHVVEWLPDDPFPRAIVEDLPDPDPLDDVAFAEMHLANETLLRRCLALASELGESVPPSTTELSDDLVLAGHQLAVLAPIGAADRYHLLAAGTPEARAVELRALLDDVRVVLEFRMNELSDPDRPADDA